MKKLGLILLGLLSLYACGTKEPVAIEEPAAPSVPDGIQLKASTETSLTFAWTAVAGATSYHWRLLQGLTEVQTGDAAAAEVTVNGLSAGTAYNFSVRSIGSGGTSAYSTALSSTTQKKTGEDEGKEEVPAIASADYANFLIPGSEEDGLARAFPGAEGGGMYTTGGRGGKVIHVTNLSDSGEGSLRAAIAEKGARIIVFDVAGIIELKSDLKISNGDVTIAGQSAPGDGICLKNYTTYIGADNVIIRFLRFRLGDEAPWSEADIKAGKADSEDATWGRYQHNIVLDHCSMSWSIDECASFYANAYFTMQWCIIAESMRSCRLHSKGDHGYGGIWGGKNASFHHNLLDHHSNRTPRFDHQYLYDGNGMSTEEFRGNVDYRNCVNYNWGSSNGCYGGEGGHYNLVNNYYKAGPDSNDKPYFIEADGGYSTTISGTKTYFDYDWAWLYLSGNYSSQYPSGSDKYPDGVYWKKAYSDYDKAYDGHVVSTPFKIEGNGADAYTTTHTAEKAMEQVCSWAGASLKRDAVDTRIAGDVVKKSGKLISDMADVKSSYGKTWPDYSGKALKDTDADGIPDAYEDAWKLNKSSAADASAKTLDIYGRYTNLEMYLHYLVKDVVDGGNQGGTYEKL